MVKIIFAPTLTRDLSLENEGVWVDLDGLGSEVRIRSANYAPYRVAMETLKKTYKDFDLANIFTEQGNAQRKLFVDAVIEHIIVDMRGLKDADDKPTQYDKEEVREFLASEEAIVVLSKIIEAMVTQEFFNQKKVIAEKN